MNALTNSLNKSWVYWKKVLNALANIRHDSKQLQSDQQKIENDQLNPEYVMSKLTELKNRSHQNNVWIDSITETPGNLGGGSSKFN